MGRRELGIFLAGLALLVLFFVLWSLNRNPVPLVPDQAGSILKSSAGSPVPPQAPAGPYRQSVHPSKQPQELQQKWSASQAKVKHRAAAMFLSSPAKDAPATRELIQRLAAAGYGIEYLDPVYEQVFRAARLDPASRERDLPYLIHLLTDFIRAPVPPIKDREVAAKMFEVIPKVPYLGPRGNLDVKDPATGERYLTDQDVLDYITSHPVIPDPPGLKPPPLLHELPPGYEMPRGK
jgi:hypothetical protein